METKTGWRFQRCLFFHNIWDNFSHRLSYFSLKPPPTRKNRSVFLAGQLTGHLFAVWHRSITKATNTRITRRARTNLAMQAERARWCHRWRQHSVAITDPHGAHGTWILFPHEVHEIPWNPGPIPWTLIFGRSRSRTWCQKCRQWALDYQRLSMSWRCWDKTIQDPHGPVVYHPLSLQVEAQWCLLLYTPMNYTYPPNKPKQNDQAT